MDSACGHICFGELEFDSSISSGTVVGTFFRRIVRLIDCKIDRRRLCAVCGCVVVPDRLLCSRRSATPGSSIEKSKPVPRDRTPVARSIRLPIAAGFCWMIDLRLTPRLVLTARLMYAIPPASRSRRKSWSGWILCR